MSKNERVMDYLLDRIEVLEKEKRDEWFQKQGLSKGNEILHQEIDNLKEKIEQYEIEREHIREIITCNISDNEIKLVYPQCDYTTLLAILDIKSKDWQEENPDLTVRCKDCTYLTPDDVCSRDDCEFGNKYEPVKGCDTCKYSNIPCDREPCSICKFENDKFENDRWERRTEDAETTD